MSSKLCNKCNIEKPLDNYHKDKSKKDGYKNYCKLCQKSYSDMFYEKNRDKIIEYSLNYEKNNLDKISHKKKIRMKLWGEKNKERRKNYNREYNIINRDKIKKHKNDNKDSFNRKRRENRNSNILIRVKNNIRTSIYLSIRRGGYTKRTNTYKILGIDYNGFLRYIESKFENWMNWDNYGKYNGEHNHGWDFDHIIPVSSASTEEDLISLNHYTNFQPLCSKVNRDIKKDKING